jgi:hypothetical protein
MTTMALAMGRRGDRQAQSLRVGAVAGVAGVLVVLLVVAALSSRSHGHSGSDRAARQTAVANWEDAVHPLISSGGQVVALGPRTAAADLASHKVPDAQMRSMASGWVRRLSDLREQIAAVSTPPSLRAAHDLLDTAMAGYVTASNYLLAASSASGSQRAQMLSDAATAGKAADHQYDLATAAIARLRAELDLPTDWSAS